MRKIVGLTIVALLVMAMVAGGTFAFFTDTESSTSNTLSAGTLDLNVNGGDTAVTTLSVSTAYPGDTGNGNTTLYNNGTLDAEMDISFGSVTNTESVGSTEYESDVIGGAGVGELGAQATFALYIDVDMSGTWNTSDIGLKSDNTTYVNSGATSLDYQTLNSYDSNSWNDVYSGNMTAGATDGFYIVYIIPTSADNTIQGDSVSVDVTFTLEQPAVD